MRSRTKSRIKSLGSPIFKGWAQKEEQTEKAKKGQPDRQDQRTQGQESQGILVVKDGRRNGQPNTAGGDEHHGRERHPSDLGTGK